MLFKGNTRIRSRDTGDECIAHETSLCKGHAIWNYSQQHAHVTRLHHVDVALSV